MIGGLRSSGLRAAIVIPERPRGSGDGASHLVLGEYGRLDREVGAGECLLSALSAVGSAYSVQWISGVALSCCLGKRSACSSAKVVGSRTLDARSFLGIDMSQSVREIDVLMALCASFE